MRAAVMRRSTLVVDTVPDPKPGPGEVLVKTLACGICGSDLHALKHGARLAELARDSGAPFDLDVGRDVVMGHEFCAEVLDYGPDTPVTVRPGARVVSMPVLFRGGRMAGVGYSNDVPGGYGELMVLNASLLLAVPNGLPTEHAALTEPLAVGVHVDVYRETADLRPTVAFECVGVPGMLEAVMRDAPHGARIVVAGVCMEADRIQPMLGINKELSLHFVLAYAPHEFADALAALANGEVDAAPWVTGRVGVDGVAQAFTDLASPVRHAKILVEPWRS